LPRPQPVRSTTRPSAQRPSFDTPGATSGQRQPAVPRTARAAHFGAATPPESGAAAAAAGRPASPPRRPPRRPLQRDTRATRSTPESPPRVEASAPPATRGSDVDRPGSSRGRRHGAVHGGRHPTQVVHAPTAGQPLVFTPTAVGGTHVSSRRHCGSTAAARATHGDRPAQLHYLRQRRPQPPFSGVAAVTAATHAAVAYKRGHTRPTCENKCCIFLSGTAGHPCQPPARLLSITLRPTPPSAVCRP